MYIKFKGYKMEPVYQPPILGKGTIFFLRFNLTKIRLLF